MGEHYATDPQIVPLVKSISKLGFTVIYSSPWEVIFTKQGVGVSYKEIVEFLFEKVRPMVEHHGNRVKLTVELCAEGYEGIICIMPSSTEVVDDVTKRLGVWVEMLHK